jgi:methionyl-tRNA formyltransferase
MMRVAFFGNCDDSWEYIIPIMRRSLDVSDPVQLVAIVTPLRSMSRREQRMFRAKRAADGVLAVARRRGPDLDTVGWLRKTATIARMTGAALSWGPSVRDPHVHALVARSGAEVGIVSGLNQIFDAAALEALPPLYNFHPSPLPAYRGGSPEFWQLLDGVTHSAMTVHRIDTGVDTGPIVRQEAFAVEPWHDASAFARISKDLGVRILDEMLADWPTSKPIEPAHAASYHPRPTRADKVVPVSAPWRVVMNRARAVGWRSSLLLPIPREHWDVKRAATHVVDEGDHSIVLGVGDIVPFPEHSDVVGTVRLIPDGGVLVACAEGAVLFRSVKPLT